MPEAWADLIKAITLLARGQADRISPFNCSHDQLTVMSDPSAFTPDEIDQLDDLGFYVDVDTKSFYSFRYGSA